MHLGRKILIGAVALALPASMAVVGFSGVASAAKAPPNPTNCKISAATINVSPPLSVAGQLDPSGTPSNTTGSVTFSSCSSGTPSPINFTISTKPAKDPNAATDGNSGNPKSSKYLGLCSQFSSAATIKGIGKSLKNLPVAGGVLKGAKAALLTSPELGFGITGTLKGGSNSTASHGATINVFLKTDANNNNLEGGCHSGPVSSIDVDTTQSIATL